MYGLFVSWLCRRTGCEIFVADMRLAPEFPFPADLEDAVLVLEALLVGGVDPSHLFVAGDSSGGGLVSSLVYSMVVDAHRPIAGVVLFSPELDLRPRRTVDHRERRSGHPAVEHPDLRLPARPRTGRRSVSAVDQDVSGWPPTFVSFGGDEMFRDAIRRFVVHLDAAGVDVDASEEAGHVPRVPHPHAVGRRQPAGLPGGGRVRHLPPRRPSRFAGPVPRPYRGGTTVTLSFSHLGICVSDLERSLRFYCDGLGFEQVASHRVGEEFGALMELEGVTVESRMVRATV